MDAAQTEAMPFLMFEGQASEALDFYMAVLPDSEILELERYGPGEPGPEGTIKRGWFQVAGLKVMCSDSFVKHGFSFTPSFSIFVRCRSEDEVRRLALALAQDGNELMPAGNYGFSTLFAWVSDRFGVSWQLNYG